MSKNDLIDHFDNISLHERSNKINANYYTEINAKRDPVINFTKINRNIIYKDVLRFNYGMIDTKSAE